MRYKLTILLTLMSAFTMLHSQEVLPLDTCRSMALRNNKTLQIANEKVRKADYLTKEARAAYLPGIDLTGSYIYNQKEISLIDKDMKIPLQKLDPATGKYEYDIVMNPLTGKPVMSPEGTIIPNALITIPKDALTYNTHNVFAGAITLTQPIFMGGKIVALNKLAKIGKEIEEDLRENTADNIVYEVDAAYWMVVSLSAKQRLAQSYVNLLDSLSHSVNLLYKEGMATKADQLNVAVKLNSANVDLTKVDNGLSLCRMNLNRICGLPIDKIYTLADEYGEIDEEEIVPTTYNMAEVYDSRTDLRALSKAVDASEQQEKIEMSSMLPNLALIGGYALTNPNLYDGFQRKFNGSFHVGAMLTVPLWHWGGNYYKYKGAKSATVIRKLELEDAKEKVDLQVSQAAFKMRESLKTYHMTHVNIEKADENLRQANLAFKEGMMTTDDVMGAQTAWLKARSEEIDAAIDVQLCKVYLSKVLGKMEY